MVIRHSVMNRLHTYSNSPVFFHLLNESVLNRKVRHLENDSIPPRFLVDQRKGADCMTIIAARITVIKQKP